MSLKEPSFSVDIYKVRFRYLQYGIRQLLVRAERDVLRLEIMRELCSDATPLAVVDPAHTPPYVLMRPAI